MSKYGINSTRATIAPFNTTVLSKELVDDIQKKIGEFEQSQMPTRKSNTRQWNRIRVNTNETKQQHRSNNKSYSPTKLMNSALYHCSYD
jgi:hypothetical protein